MAREHDSEVSSDTVMIFHCDRCNSQAFNITTEGGIMCDECGVVQINIEWVYTKEPEIYTDEDQ